MAYSDADLVAWNLSQLIRQMELRGIAPEVIAAALRAQADTVERDAA